MDSKAIEMIEQFSDYLFWDVERTNLDLERSKVYIIDRVLSHGMLSDWFLIKKIYGKQVIREVVLNLRYLDKYALSFCSAYFGEPIHHFRCSLTHSRIRDTGIIEKIEQGTGHGS